MDWQLRIKLEDEDRDVAEAFAAGAAKLLGRDVQLLRIEHGDEIHVANYKPRRASAGRRA